MSSTWFAELGPSLSRSFSRRGALRLLAGSTLGGFALLGARPGEARKRRKAKGKRKGRKKANPTATITICHQGQTVTVSASAAAAHQSHGDLLGACPPPPLFRAGSFAIVTADVNLRAEPSRESPIVTQLDRGTVVTITGPAVPGASGAWWPVTAPTGSGYVQEVFLRPVDPPRLIITTRAAEGPLLPDACYIVDSWRGTQPTAEGCDNTDGANDGITTITLREPGPYIVAQTQVGSGYEPTTDQYAVNVSVGQPTRLTVTNTPV